mgnify:CR=1 FL=1
MPKKAAGPAPALAAAAPAPDDPMAASSAPPPAAAAEEICVYLRGGRVVRDFTLPDGAKLAAVLPWRELRGASTVSTEELDGRMTRAAQPDKPFRRRRGPARCPIPCCLPVRPAAVWSMPMVGMWQTCCCPGIRNRAPPWYWSPTPRLWPGVAAEPCPWWRAVLVFKAWRSPAFRVQALAVLVAAFAMTAMLILRDTVDQRFNQRTAVALGADLILEGTRFPEPAQRQQLAETRHAESVNRRRRCGSRVGCGDPCASCG